LFFLFYSEFYCWNLCAHVVVVVVPSAGGFLSDGRYTQKKETCDHYETKKIKIGEKSKHTEFIYNNNMSPFFFLLVGKEFIQTHTERERERCLK
jgi:hypothetical protein